MAHAAEEPSKSSRCALAFCVALVVALASGPTAASTEWVYVDKVLDDDDKGIVVRGNGNAYLIEKGVGCLSFWRHEGKRVLISSPGLFLGVGSKLLLPDADQECRIWNAKDLGPWSSSRQIPAPLQSNQPPTANNNSVLVLQIALQAVGFDVGAVDGVLGPKTLSALRQFQITNALPESRWLDAPTAIRLSEVIEAKYPNNPNAIDLALAVLNAAKNSTGTSIRSGSGCETGHWVSSTSGNGEIVSLEDGSIWQVDTIDRIYSALWLFTEEIIVCDEATMINTDTEDRVSVRRLN